MVTLFHRLAGAVVQGAVEGLVLAVVFYAVLNALGPSWFLRAAACITRWASP